MPKNVRDWSELRSVRYKVTKNVKQNDKNNVSGLKELPTESLDTNSMKKTFKVFNISKTLSSKKSKTKIISSQNILPALSTPTKRKLLEEKNVQNLISRFENSPAANLTGVEGVGLESPAKRWRYKLIAEMNNHPN